jgi:alcohol dehydrogenase class IV
MLSEPDFFHLDLRKFLAPEFVFGEDARFQAGGYCKKLGGRKVFLVTDKGLLKTRWVNELESVLKDHKIDFVIYSNVSPNPRDSEVMTGAEEYKKSNCNIILAIGGGSVVDCAKGIGIVISNHGNIKQFEGVDNINRPMPPLICIPTTSGASADVSQFAIINNKEQNYKMAIISKAVVPDISLIDPVVLTTMDDFLTSCTGMDALCHAFEAYVSNASSSVTDLFALNAIKLLNENLVHCLNDPLNIHIRGKVMLASLYAGLAFSNASLGCVHATAHSLGGYLDLPHGECNAILLPHVVNYNFEAVSDKYTHIACEMGLTKNSQSHAREFLFEYLQKLKLNLNIFTTLGKLGVTNEIINHLAEKAINDPCNATNPRPPKKQDLEDIYHAAL